MERFDILGRTDLAELLLERISTLDQNDYLTAQVLKVIDELSLNPEKNLPWNPVILTEDTQKVKQKPLTWESILEEDPLPMDKDYWKEFSYESDDLTDLSLNSLDEGQEKNSNVFLNSDTHDKHDIHSLVKTNTTLDFNNEELYLVLNAISSTTESNQSTEARYTQALIQRDLKQREELHFLQDTAYWNNFNNSELHHCDFIRDIIFALRGEKSLLYDRTTRTINESVQLTQSSEKLSSNILLVFRKYIEDIDMIREFFELPGIDKLPLSIFGSALQNNILSKFYAFLNSYELMILENNKEEVVSVMSFLAKLKKIAQPWALITPIIHQLRQLRGGDEHTKFSFILDELFVGCNKANSALTFAAGTETDNGEPTDVFTLRVITSIFQDAFRYYGLVLDEWMRRGLLQKSSDLFLRQNYPDSSNASNNSPKKASTRYFWSSKFSVDFSQIPPFLNDAFCQQMFEAGSSIQLLRIFNELSYMYDDTNTEDPNISIEIMEANSCFLQIFFPTDFNNRLDLSSEELQQWWLSFRANLEMWIRFYHSHNSNMLETRIFQRPLDFETGNLVQFFEHYLSLYLIVEPPVLHSRWTEDVGSLDLVSCDFMEELFKNLDQASIGFRESKRKTLLDKYIVENDFEECLRNHQHLSYKRKYSIAKSPRLIVAIKKIPEYTEELMSYASGDSNLTIENSLFEQELARENTPLGFLSHLKLVYPVPWVAQEIIRDRTMIYQEIWVQLFHWAWARHVVLKIHKNNLKNEKRSVYTESYDNDSEEREEERNQSTLVTYRILLFIDTILEYFHRDILSNFTSEFLKFLSPNPGHIFKDSSKPLSHSFQSIINYHNSFINSISDLCFTYLSSSVSLQIVDTTSLHTTEIGILASMAPNSIADTLEKEFGEFSSSTERRHTTAQNTRDLNRHLYIKNIRESLNNILYYCAVTIVQDQHDLLYLNMPYFTQLVESFKNSLQLGIQKNCFGNNTEYIEILLQRL